MARSSHPDCRATVGFFFRTRKRPDDVQELLFAESDKRAAQQCAERQRITTIGEHPRDRDEVLYFLPAKETFAGLGCDWDAPALKGFFIAPELCAGWREQGYVARLAGSSCTGFAILDWMTADQSCAKFSDLKRCMLATDFSLKLKQIGELLKIRYSGDQTLLGQD